MEEVLSVSVGPAVGAYMLWDIYDDIPKYRTKLENQFFANYSRTHGWISMNQVGIDSQKVSTR